MYLKYKNDGNKKRKTNTISNGGRIRIRIPSIVEFQKAEENNYRIPLELIYP